MKYTRKGTNEAASKACETEPKPRVRRSAQLVPERESAGFACPAASVVPRFSACCQTWEICCRILCVYLERSCAKTMAWFEEENTSPVIKASCRNTAAAAATPRGR